MADYSTSPVNVDEGAIAKLTNLYKSTYKSIVREIVDAKGFQLYNRRQILANIQDALEKLGVKVADFIEQEIPAMYKEGARDGVRQLRDQGVEVRIRSGFSRFHKEAIAALVDETQTSFLETMTGINREAKVLLGKGVRDLITLRMAGGAVEGKSLKEVKATVVGILKERGLAALIDKGGHKWELDRYAEMLIRTKAVEARNRGLANRMVENGYDLVQVTTHNSDHEECRVWEGKVLSLTGQTKGYPTVADAEKQGLFHPNCKHAINVVVPELATDIGAYR
jgi:hypothetical protein